jgi:hypothetical protein
VPQRGQTLEHASQIMPVFHIITRAQKVCVSFITLVQLDSSPMSFLPATFALYKDEILKSGGKSFVVYAKDMFMTRYLLSFITLIRVEDRVTFYNPIVVPKGAVDPTFVKTFFIQSKTRIRQIMANDQVFMEA